MIFVISMVDLVGITQNKFLNKTINSFGMFVLSIDLVRF